MRGGEGMSKTWDATNASDGPVAEADALRAQLDADAADANALRARVTRLAEANLNLMAQLSVAERERDVAAEHLEPWIRDRDAAVSRAEAAEARLARARGELAPALVALREWEGASVAAHVENPNDDGCPREFHRFWRAAELAVPRLDAALAAPAGSQPGECPQCGVPLTAVETVGGGPRYDCENPACVVQAPERDAAPLRDSVLAGTMVRLTEQGAAKVRAMLAYHDRSEVLVSSMPKRGPRVVPPAPAPAERGAAPTISDADAGRIARAILDAPFHPMSGQPRGYPAPGVMNTHCPNCGAWPISADAAPDLGARLVALAEQTRSAVTLTVRDTGMSFVRWERMHREFPGDSPDAAVSALEAALREAANANAG